MNRYYLGIDTSAYTTSIAVVDEKNNIVFDSRKILRVKRNKKGLRQQEAVFQHLNNLPTMIDVLTSEIEIEKLSTIAVSNRPRNIEGSYMPVFVVGKGQAYIISKLLNIPYKEFSHQEGHIAAAMMNSEFAKKDKFLAFHLSGGTTELLIVENRKENLNIDLIGGTLDISVGQLIDRIGVELGYLFPCGKQLDQLSKSGSIISLKYPVSTKSTWANFSGMENFLKKLIKEDEYEYKHIIKTMFYTIGLTLEKIILSACIEENINDVVLIGGVSSNSFIGEYLLHKLERKGINIFIPNGKLCTDNGVGIAYFGKTKKGYKGG